MTAYKAVYLGGEYKVHTKYSQLLNIMFITMFYGPGMPLLFPISALNFLTIYITERITIAFLVRLPPALDDKLTKNCIKVLSFSPIMFILNAYWMYGNRQIFANSWSFVHDSNHAMLSGHYFEPDVFKAVLFVVLFGLTMWMRSRIEAKKFDVDEDLPHFFRAMRLQQANVVVKMEQNVQDNFGL